VQRETKITDCLENRLPLTPLPQVSRRKSLKQRLHPLVLGPWISPSSALSKREPVFDSCPVSSFQHRPSICSCPTPDAETRRQLPVARHHQPRGPDPYKLHRPSSLERSLFFFQHCICRALTGGHSSGLIEPWRPLCLTTRIGV
jgi:hypothetical protein